MQISLNVLSTFWNYTKYLNRLIFHVLTNDMFAIDAFKSFEIKIKI